MIIKAKHNFIIHPFFKAYTLRKMKSHFKSVEFFGGFVDRNLPVLVISNHCSWWDGFWLMFLNLKLLHRKFHFMMLENQLRKHWFFKYTGGFSVSKNSRSIIETLNYTHELLQNPKNMVMMFPQGKIVSMHEQQIVFEKGVERIIKSCNNDLHVLFVANLVDYFSSPKPSLSIFVKEYFESDFSAEALQSNYQNFYNEAIIQQKGRGDL